MKNTKICFFTSKQDIYHNIAKWSYDNPILYVIGISGSGKTTLVNSIKEYYKVPCISLDALRFYETSNQESRKMVNNFISLYPEVLKYIQSEWNTSNNFFKKEKLFTYYVCLFNNFLTEYAKKNKIKIIVEGIQPFARFPKHSLVHCPRIIKGTSSYTSFLNALNRDKPQHKREIVFRFLRYSIIQFIRLNIYLSYWEKHEKQLPETAVN